MCTHQNCPNKAILVSTHDIWFNIKIWKIIPKSDLLLWKIFYLHLDGVKLVISCRGMYLMQHFISQESNFHLCRANKDIIMFQSMSTTVHLNSMLAHHYTDWLPSSNYFERWGKREKINIHRQMAQSFKDSMLLAKEAEFELFQLNYFSLKQNKTTVASVTIIINLWFLLKNPYVPTR